MVGGASPTPPPSALPQPLTSLHTPTPAHHLDNVTVTGRSHSTAHLHPRNLTVDKNIPCLQSQTRIPRKKHEVPTRQKHYQEEAGPWERPRHTWAPVQKPKDVPTAEGPANRQPQGHSESSFFPPPCPTKPPGIPPEHLPLQRQQLGNLGPGDAGLGVGPAWGWGQGFPSHLTWQHAAPPSRSCALGKPRQACQASYSPSYPGGTFHTADPR